ncbi:MAG TPA: hypothetical protein VIJ38_04255 [Acidobacteriaceae bacterium]
MVGDLIRASCPDINAFRFPSGDKGQVRGFDGHLETTWGGNNVPEGNSYWEFGTEETYQKKGSQEFERCSKLVSEEERKDATFVFVSPWTWDSSKADNKIEDWEELKSKESIWKSVHFIDGVKLEAWLQSCPAVSAWHARNTLKSQPVTGARSTDEFWWEFADHFKPRITEEVLLCERQNESQRLIDALMAKSGSISFSADSPDEVVAFAVAAIRKSKPEVRLFLEARTIIVDNMDAGRELLTESNLIYLLRDSAAKAPGQFADKAPTLIPLGRQQRRGNPQQLSRPSGQVMGMAMSTMGIPENQAITMARGCGRSLAALARQFPGGSSEPPAWMPHGNLVLPAILAGGWDAGNDLDRTIIQALAESDDYRKYERKLRRFISEADPPFDQVGTVWKVRAPLDAFIHIGELIGTEHLDLLRITMSTVFSQIEPDPDPDEIVRLSRPPKPGYSEWLRDGLATTLLLIAVWEKQARLRLGTGAGQRFADELVRDLPGLATNHRLLASLRDELPLMAEAAPSPLLSALELMLEGNGDAIRPLFKETEGLLAPVSHHIGVLWALETLAWDPDYFDRAVRILARLAAIDPGGRLGNRPINSLRESFILWTPNTNAPAAQRMAALDDIIKSLPAVGWRLVCMLLPSTYGTSSPTARPRLREAGASERANVTYRELWEGQSAVVQRAVRLADHDPSRWLELIPVIANFAPEDRPRAFEALDATLARLGEEQRQTVWGKVRDEVAKHEKFATAVWALPADQLQPFRGMVDRYAPSDPLSAVVWLFDTWMLDAHRDEEEAGRRRINAVRELLDKHGLDAVLRLGLTAKLPHKVVEALGEANVSRADIETLLTDSIRVDPTSNFAIMLSNLHRRVVGEKESEVWIASAMRANGWSPETMARLLLAWPEQTSTWHFARRLGEGVAAAYWMTMGPHWLNSSKHEFLRAELTLLHYGRGMAALQTALNRLKDVPTRLILRILDSILTELNTGTSSPRSMLSYELENAFEELDRREDASDLDVARKEFAFLTALEHGKRPLRFHKVMATDPDLYHHVLCQVFHGKDETTPESQPSESERVKWRLNYSLLSKFAQLPGQTESGVNVVALSQWIDRVRELAAQTDRVEIADIYIGHLFAHAMSDPDGAWPHCAVREQIERLASEPLERGILTEQFNMRGAHFKALYDGGGQERALAAENRSYAELLAPWPRTAAVLRAITKNWEAHAEYEDVQASQRKLKS